MEKLNFYPFNNFGATCVQSKSHCCNQGIKRSLEFIEVLGCNPWSSTVFYLLFLYLFFVNMQYALYLLPIAICSFNIHMLSV